jgi:hypothetical protein
MSSPFPSVPASVGEASALSNSEAFLEEALSDLRPDLVETRRAGPGRPRVARGVSVCCAGSAVSCTFGGC